jgi:hypothetical protein
MPDSKRAKVQKPYNLAHNLSEAIFEYVVDLQYIRGGIS